MSYEVCFDWPTQRATVHEPSCRHFLARKEGPRQGNWWIRVDTDVVRRACTHDEAHSSIRQVRVR